MLKLLSLNFDFCVLWTTLSFSPPISSHRDVFTFDNEHTKKICGALALNPSVENVENIYLSKKMRVKNCCFIMGRAFEEQYSTRYWQCSTLRLRYDAKCFKFWEFFLQAAFKAHVRFSLNLNDISWDWRGGM